MEMVEEIKQAHQHARKGTNIPEIRKAVDRAQLIYRELKRQGGLNDPLKHYEIRRKILDRNPNLR
jgi:hypothetical protein